MFTEIDRQLMARALELARQGLMTTAPNPRVGCVIAQRGEVVGEGWHRFAGEPHAEVHALEQAGGRARGATAYVTLEPCSHHGRTPPCVDALIAAGVGTVIAAMEDPNPLVHGRGLDRLRAAGIDVRCGLMGHEAVELNIGFVQRMMTGRPWVRAKVAASLDGHTALGDGQSQWITGAAARADGHFWRARASAILTGIGTVIADDPAMTVREIDVARQPRRVVVDSRLRVSETARLLQGGAWIFHAVPVDGPGASDDAALDATRRRIERLRKVGCDVISMPGAHGRVDLPAMLQELGRRGINELHVEAGAVLNGALMQAGCVDEWLLYLAPSVLGQGIGMAQLPEPPSLDATTLLRMGRQLRWTDMAMIGTDVRLMARDVRQLHEGADGIHGAKEPAGSNPTGSGRRPPSCSQD